VDPDSSRVPPPRLRRLAAPRHGFEATLRVTVTDGRGRPVRDAGLARWLAAVAPAGTLGEVAVALASDALVRTLNQRYRHTNSPTDVLSFPAGERGFLGDIVIATGVAKRQARERRHPYRTELRVLALHGLLHLLGYDHENPVDKGAMARIEGRLRRKGGLSDGLIGRTERVRPAGPARVDT
jgi:probable rRNA maturation factor